MKTLPGLEHSAVTVIPLDINIPQTPLLILVNVSLLVPTVFRQLCFVVYLGVNCFSLGDYKQS